MQSQSTGTEEGFLSQLQCPECMEYLRPPITLCVNGHNICSICRPKVQHCPTCGQQLSDIRNLALETVARNMKYTCPYQNYGCGEILAYDMIREHQEKCRYRPQICPVVKPARGSCSWIGLHSDMKGHLKEQHRDLCCDYVEGESKVLNTPMCVSQFVFASDEVFYFRFQDSSNTLYGVVQYIGPAENAAKYKYKVEFVNTDNTEGATVMHLSSSFAENFDDIFRSGNCGKLQIDRLSRLKNEMVL
uniref:RING-type E3 ubiquitin transferase n=1 Tax=Coptotermes formosanus TaxID=36987 RepID=R4UK47_COPFO|nr:E3 ubiquitin-protein ligase siah-1 [Coptotermes formosanus]